MMLTLSTMQIFARDFVVTLDAGHGGKDYGAIGEITNEKTVTLAVVRQLGSLIEKNLEDVHVVYTRDTDIFIPLNDRARISNDAGTDLFISVHINSVDRRNRNRRSIEGCQVYSLGLHKSAENLAVAKRENSVMELEADHTEKYADFDPNSLESDIIFELSQNKRLDQSIEFADAVHKELVGTAGRQPKGVRQAGFWVLWATSAPSVLIELDFICNPKSERYLHSSDGQKRMVTAIYNAFCSYLNTYGSGIVGRKIQEAKAIHLEPAQEVNYPEELLPKKSDDFKAEPKKALEAPQRSGIPMVESDSEEQYFIQILSSAQLLSPESNELKGMKDVSVYRDHGSNKYVVGPYRSLQEAKKKVKSVKKSFPECFIVTMRDGVRTGFYKP